MSTNPSRKPRRFPQEVLDALACGKMEECLPMPYGSNYTFRARLSHAGGHQCDAIYKPRRGEAPLWDFPDGTLYLREHAAYLLSEQLGWGLVPPTTIRDGLYGIGSVQLYVDAAPSEHYFTLRDRFRDDMLRVCTFDVIANNADRKAGHCLLGKDGNLWIIDHGIAFHSLPKLRTVIWDFAGEAVPEWVLEDVDKLRREFAAPGGLREALNPLLNPEEVEAVCHRLDDLLEQRVFPLPGPRRSVPWPWL